MKRRSTTETIKPGLLPGFLLDGQRLKADIRQGIGPTYGPTYLRQGIGRGIRE